LERPWPGGLGCREERLLIGERRREFGHALDLHVAVLIGDVAPGLGRAGVIGLDDGVNRE